MAKSEGAYPNAHPTAPGGMSQQALVAELENRHGWDKQRALALKWPEQIDAVIQGRLDREKEEKRVNMSNKSEPLLIGMPHSYDYRFDNHAGAGPSSAERWMSCTASLQTSREFLETLTPNQQAEFAKGSSAARQGTTAHAAGESEALLMLGRITEEEHDNTLLELTLMPEDEGEAYDDEMGEYVSEYVDLIRTYHEAGHEILIETRVEALVPLIEMPRGKGDPLLDEVYALSGSLDFAAMPTPEEMVLAVGDYKHGEGMDVSVESNPQIRIYALGVLSLLADEEGNLPDLERIDYYIIQPRLGGIKQWSESLDDLLDWRDEVLAPALTYALHGIGAGATFNPTDAACQWCPARGRCPALAEARIAAAPDLFDAIVEAEVEGEEFLETTSLSDERLGTLLLQIKGLIGIHDDLKEEVQRRLHRGGSVPGFELVTHTPKRTWKADAAEALDPDSHTDEGAADLPRAVRAALWKEPTLRTPTQALALLKQKGIDGDVTIGELINVPAKVPLVAAVERGGDRRKTWTGTPPEQMFADEGEA